MVYELKKGAAKVCLSSSLDMLEFSNGKTAFYAGSPFVFNWTGIPVSVKAVKDIRVTADDEKIRIDFADFYFPVRFPGNDYHRPAKQHVPDFRQTVTLTLEDGDLVAGLSPIENLGDNTIRVLFAADFFRASTAECAQLVLPVNYGIRLDFPRADLFARNFVPGGQWNLPVHGLFRMNGGIGLWCEDPERSTLVEFNQDQAGSLSAATTQIFHKMANVSRKMRFMLFDGGADFRDLGRRCRELRMSSGRFRTLQEKMAENPEVKNLPGTVFWKHNVFFKERPAGIGKSYSLYVTRPQWNENEGLPNNWTAREVFRTAAEKGFDRVTVCNTGWNRFGYDSGYPVRLPPNPERGTEQEFRKAVREARKLSEGYTFSVHDNYIDAYPGEDYHEEEMLQIMPGIPHATFIWQGGQAHHLCSECALKYARRDMPRVAALTGRGCIYVDVIAVNPLRCCLSEKHPVDCAGDWRNKREIFRLAKQHFGALAVEGCGSDYYADLADIGAYGGLHFTGILPRAGGPDAVPVPLWQMVYHDSVLNFFGEGYSPVHGAEYRLYQALYTLLPASFDDNQKKISIALRSAETAPMTDFQELVPRTVTRAPDGSFLTRGVARAVYGDGTEVIANFNDRDFIFAGRRIPPKDYLILYYGRPVG